jgi:hypothetical protein
MAPRQQPRSRSAAAAICARRGYELPPLMLIEDEDEDEAEAIAVGVRLL